MTTTTSSSDTTSSATASSPSTRTGAGAVGVPSTLMDVPVRDVTEHPRNLRRDVGDITDLAGNIRVLGVL